MTQTGPAHSILIKTNQTNPNCPETHLRGLEQRIAMSVKRMSSRMNITRGRIHVEPEQDFR
jgi:hypothetical protein